MVMTGNVALQPAVLGDVCACGRGSDMLSHQVFYQLILKNFHCILGVTRNRD